MTSPSRLGGAIDWKPSTVRERAAARAAGAAPAAGHAPLRTLLILLATAFLLPAVSAAPALADSCPNAQFRTGPAVNLPDCRAYEQVSPTDKNGSDISSTPGNTVAAVAGGSALYASVGGFAGASGSGNPLFQYMAMRATGNWTTSPVTPTSSSQPGVFQGSGGVFGAAPDLRSLVARSNQPLTPGTEPGVTNLFLRRADGSFTLVTTTQPPASFGSFFLTCCYAPVFAWASADFSHVLFDADAPLTPDAPPGSTAFLTYEWSNGALRLVSILPDGSVPANGTAAGSLGSNTFNSSTTNALSSDGSHAVFTSQDDNQVYLRDIPASSTAEASASQGGADATGAQPATYETASTDDSKIFFTSAGDLTPDANTGDRNSADPTFCPDCAPNLYEYDTPSGTLTDLSVDANPADVQLGANVQGVVGVSQDGAYVYFVATGQLIPGQGTAGGNNVYLYHAGHVTFVAGDISGNTSGIGGLFEPSGVAPARVTQDGQHLAFMSSQSLTGYDNAGESEVFEYDAGGNRLTCVSCNPSGQRPVGPANIPGGGYVAIAGRAPIYEPHDVTDDGSKVFFDSFDALVPQAANGKQNVYEWEGGHVYLISSGAGPDNSYFADASPSGSDVFFTTRDQLVGQDADNNVDLYDARVGGGLAAQWPSPSPACSGDECQGPLSGQPSPPLAATVSFFGPGNASPGAASAKVHLLTRVVHGSTFFIRVRVPGPGRIAITGAGIRTARRSVARGGTYKLKVTLTARQERALEHRRKLRLTLHVSYAPPGGQLSTAAVGLTVKR